MYKQNKWINKIIAQTSKMYKQKKCTNKINVQRK